MKTGHGTTGLRRPPRASTDLPADDGVARLRVATYNIHKGVRGVGPRKRLEIHNLGLGVKALDADLVFLQEVRLFHHRDARRFDRTWFGWPEQGQAEFLAPEGYEAAYRTNAVTRDGEHGNALLSRWPLGEVEHHDVSDHRFEQRGLLHVVVHWQGQAVHCIVAHFGLVHASRIRQAQRLGAYIAAEVPPAAPVLVAGDFNDWGERLDPALVASGLVRAAPPGTPRSPVTFPSRMPLFALDRMYTRGLRCLSMTVPRGPAWARMSDHLPLVAELGLA
ncbi:endonuclease/exonuclease/phosphatase family protein [Sphaerotilus microaerophilus]|jgi:endonuclease/exonuclease/phosphatase family metal-dependent hydrolase|uniref:Endonuclease/exonuclease/phosphatase n=1 Tax=Sphaerotilus microaerophilus TaxID=2914710 RepID=A0ABN6PX13_9BURK|nr:endonuclease/exonuclease/phosphatase family protein [Sphaerotilus sp. FB-5]BDI08157.1 endonuclease/exonuclease/phosphatase [Sphaerotilus sp. FB-5]